MAASMVKLFTGLTCPKCHLVSGLKRSFGSSTAVYDRFSKRRWNIEHGLPESGYEYGPLTEVPDWSFADGRPAPLSGAAARRQEENRKLAERAMLLIEEMNFAKERQKLLQAEEEEVKQKILSNKLKPKT